MKRFFWAPALLLGLAACHSQSGQPATALADAPAAAAGAVVATSSPGTSYQVYRALLPGQADSLTLHLVATPRSFEEAGTAYFGSYYGADGHLYALQGQPSAAPDSVLLFEASPDKAVAATGSDLLWRLRRQPGGGLAGTVGGRALRLRPVASAAGALTLATRYLADSAAAFAGEATSPRCHLSWQALVPVGGPAGMRQALETAILRDLRGDSLGGLPVGSLSVLYKQQRRQFFSDYRADAADLRPTAGDTAGLGGYRSALRYDEQLVSFVFCQQADLLSLGYFRYSYSGGAHGIYGTTGASYDLRTGHRLRYDDIFVPAAQAQLPALLGQAVRPLVGLRPNEPLDQQLFVKTMPVTRNVLLTPGGVAFIYGPYEIASYAQGEVRVFLPLAQVRSLLRPGLPLPGSGPVAAR